MEDHDGAAPAAPLRNSLWNLLYRVIASTDRSGTAWGAILRGSCLAFFRETIDDLPAGDGETARRALKERFFAIPDQRVWDLFEFLLEDDRACLKEVDRKLVRRGMNPVLEEEGAPVRLFRDRFVPLPDELGLDAVESAGETMTLFDLSAAALHLQSAVSFLSRRPEPGTREAVREAMIAVAAVVRSLSDGSGEIAMGTIAPVAERLGIANRLLEGIEGTLAHCRSASGLPGTGSGGVAPPDLEEAAFLVVGCSAVINLLLSRAGKTGGI